MPEHPIRIVSAGHHGKLVYNGGPLLTAVNVVTVYWGETWTAPPQAQLRKDLDAYFDYIVQSPLIDQLSAEYSVQGKNIGHGQHSQSVLIPDATVSKLLSDAEIQTAIQGWITGGTLPPSTPNTLYFLFLPQGTVDTLQGEQSCTNFCGYHDAINPNGNPIFYAVMPYQDCIGCTSANTPAAQFEAFTMVSSHELSEAITDPIPGQGWYNQKKGEVGDLCEGHVKNLNGYTIQLEWSNAQNRCV